MKWKFKIRVNVIKLLSNLDKWIFIYNVTVRRYRADTKYKRNIEKHPRNVDYDQISRPYPITLETRTYDTALSNTRLLSAIED